MSAIFENFVNRSGKKAKLTKYVSRDETTTSMTSTNDATSLDTICVDNQHVDNTNLTDDRLSIEACNSNETGSDSMFTTPILSSSPTVIEDFASVQNYPVYRHCRDKSTSSCKF